MFMNTAFQRLRHEPRCRVAKQDEHNLVGGLLDLIAVVQPCSVLEIGSNRGVSTEAFLLTCDQVTVIDPWQREAGTEEGSYSEFIARCGKYAGQLTIIRGYSPGSVMQLTGSRFDLAYIDAQHDYESVLADICACHQVAVRLSGHDYNRSGVKKAVDQFGIPQVFSDTSWLLPVGVDTHIEVTA